MSTSEHVLILFRNRIKQGTLTASSSAQPLNYLTMTQSTRRHRFDDDDTAPQYKVVFPEKYDISHCAFGGHNLSVSASYRIRAWADDAMTDLIFDTGVVNYYRATLAFGEGAWGRNFGGFEGGEVFDLENPIRTVATGGIAAKVITFDFQDPTNVDGIAVGLLFAGEGYQPAINAAIGDEDDVLDKTELIESVSSVVVRKGERADRRLIPFPHQTETDAKQHRRIRKYSGSSEPVIIQLLPALPEPDRTEHTIYGLITRYAPIRRITPELFSTALTIRST